jgi:hypothetical protein
MFSHKLIIITLEHFSQTHLPPNPLGFPLPTTFFFFLLLYFCSFHLEHRASVKRFVSLQFLNLRESVGLLGRGISRSEDRYLTHKQNKNKRTSMHSVGFETTIADFERMKTFHALDREATVIVWQLRYTYIKPCGRLRGRFERSWLQISSEGQFSCLHSDPQDKFRIIPSLLSPLRYSSGWVLASWIISLHFSLFFICSDDEASNGRTKKWE